MSFSVELVLFLVNSRILLSLPSMNKRMPINVSGRASGCIDKDAQILPMIVKIVPKYFFIFISFFSPNGYRVTFGAEDFAVEIVR